MIIKEKEIWHTIEQSAPFWNHFPRCFCPSVVARICVSIPFPVGGKKHYFVLPALFSFAFQSELLEHDISCDTTGLKHRSLFRAQITGLEDKK